MRRLAWCALALAAACGSERKASPAPLDGVREPTGLAVLDGRLLVLNSNADLAYDEASGGALLALGFDPYPSLTASVVAGVRVHSMGGDLAVARLDPMGTAFPDAEACGSFLSSRLAVFATRGSNTLNAVAVGADGALSCDAPGARCGVPTQGVGFGDPLGVAVACGGGRARAYFGYLNAQNAAAWVGELDLTTFTVRNANVGAGPIRGLAYDRDRDRLFLAGSATGTPTPLRWIDLAGCTLGSAGPAGCTVGSAALPMVAGAYGLELHAIAFGHSATPGRPRDPGVPLRAYVTGTLYDQGTAATSGFRTTTVGSLLVVLDLLDDAAGGVEPTVVAIHDMPSGARNVAVLPRMPGWSATRRDVVAVVSVETGSLTILDDETGRVDRFGLSASGASATGAPILGHQLYGLAVDPTVVGSKARAWVGSFAEGFVTPIDVTLDPVVAATFAGEFQHKITGAKP